MPSPSEQPLKPNPFTTYRDPQTGIWIVETDSSSATSDHREPSPQSWESPSLAS